MIVWNHYKDDVIPLNGGNSLDTKPKLTVSRDGVQFLVKFPERGDTRWLPHIECAMLKLARKCGIHLLAAATEHYGYAAEEARDYLRHAAETVAGTWRGLRKH